MDNKTYESMNEKVKKYEELQNRKVELERIIRDLTVMKIDKGHYENTNELFVIPEPYREAISSAMIRVFETAIKNIDSHIENI